MRKEDCDRIIVETNDKMGKIIQWYQDNQEWIDKEEFLAPMENGCIILKEEELEVTFESKGDVVELAVYPKGGSIPALTWDYNPEAKRYSNYRYPAHLSEKKRMMMQMALIHDRTDFKESIKYHALMMFAAHYDEIVVIDEKQSVRRTKHEVKMLRKNPNQPLSLVKKTYVVNEFSEDVLRRYGEKRSYTKPDHEVRVRGFWRRSKNGKKSWVKPFSRYKDKGGGSHKEYKV